MCWLIRSKLSDEKWFRGKGFPTNHIFKTIEREHDGQTFYVLFIQIRLLRNLFQENVKGILFQKIPQTDKIASCSFHTI